MSGVSELYACLYAREFPAQALLRLRPEVRDKACVVMEGEAPLQTVCSLNAKARALGVLHGMTVVELETFAGIAVLARSHAMEKTAKAMLLGCAGVFSPRVEDRSEGTAFLCGIDITGTRSLFGSPAALARGLLERVQALGITARVTVSRNLNAAFCMARGLRGSTVVRVIAEGEEAKALAPLPVAVLPLSDMQAETLEQWGIHTLGMLAALPEAALIARMGQQGKRLRLLSRGECAHLLQPVEAPLLLAEAMELDTPVELLESLLFAISVMLDALIERATMRIVALAAVSITLRLEGGGEHTRTVRTALPGIDRQAWIKLLHLDLEAHPPHAAIVAIRLEAEPGSTSKIQLGLFSPQLPEAARLDVTLARIRALVGEACAGRAVLGDTHARDGFHMEPFVVISGERDSGTRGTPRMAVRRIRPPEAVLVTLRNSRPAEFFYRERRYVVEQAYGPWCVGGEWWSRTLWGQEQWDLVARAEDDAMICCCMVRDLMRDQWQMEALYD